MSSDRRVRRAVVLGGGVAGLTAAFGLAERGFRVQLLESRARLGGRAFSTPDRTFGDELDNGPHVLLGCYRALRALLARLCTEDGFRQERSLALAFRTKEARTLRLALPRLPVPLAMPWALLRLPVPFAARWRALRGMVATLRRPGASDTLGDWLRRHAQLGVPDAFLWRPLCRAIMNVEPEQAAAADFLATLREAFTGSAAHAAFWLPLRPWHELLGGPAVAALRAVGCDVRTSARVVAAESVAGRVAVLRLGDGERIEVGPDDVVVAAVPWFAFAALWPGLGPRCGELQSSPIVTAYCRQPATAAPLPDDGPVTAFVDGDPFHFLIRRPGDDTRHFAMLAGGNRSFDGQDVATIAERARRQLAACWPSAQFDALEVRIRKEHHATFVAACGTRDLRPVPGRLPDGPANLFVCGDWTATGLPATLEGAARSAEAMLVAMAR
ncbi:MAG: FAD-dependent oxidoreductase [Planctomycetes bacterium]|nr:FAD-dependent oxidoreductase [Planctomycetota bacterium]